MDVIHDLLKPELIWFLIGLTLLVGEIVVPGLIIFFFGVGAWIVALTCVLTSIGINSQLLLFILSSVLSLVLLRKTLKGIFLGHTSGTQELTETHDACIGKHVLVTVAISPQLAGKVELNGTDWAATADHNIAAGTVVEVMAKENLTLIVKTLS